MLTAVGQQTERVGQVVIADGAHDARELVDSYAGQSPVQWIGCETQGQIAQRNYALRFLSEDCRVVIYMDDDIVLQPTCIAELVSFWNSRKIEPAGVGLNITNMPAQPDHLLRHLFVMQSRPYGRVLRSGYNAPVTGVDRDISVQWLAGGATAWRRDILESHFNRPITTRWAIGEDLNFSYPISKREELLVCANARCSHEDLLVEPNFATSRYRAYRAVIARYAFVARNTDLSRSLFFWMIIGQLLGRAGRAAAGRPAELGAFLGTARALLDCLRHVGAKDVDALLEEDA